MVSSLGNKIRNFISDLSIKARSLFFYFLNNKKELLKIGVLIFILIFTSFQKFKVFDEAGGDFEVYRKASRDFLSGKNPYEYTVKSYKDDGNQKREDTTKAKKDDLGHGFAYLPGLLYIQTPLYVVSENLGIPIQRVWRTPVLLADIGVSILLILALYKRNYFATLIAVLAWSYSPFFLVRGSYTNTEPFPVFFLLLALMLLEKYNKLSAIAFALSVAFKTFPIMVLPVFLIKSKNKFQFLFVGFLVFLVISIPFMKSVPDFWTYIQGALLVHGDRELQGRPLLSYIQFYTGIHFAQVSLFKFYVYLALLIGPILVLITAKKNLTQFVQTLITFSTFYLFTPVLSRTHFIWFIPFYIMGMLDFVVPSNAPESKKRWILFSVAIIIFYLFYALYLNSWDRGFRYQGNKILL